MACGSGISHAYRTVFDPCCWNPVLGRYPHAVGGGCKADPVDYYLLVIDHPPMPPAGAVETWRIGDPTKPRVANMHDLACTVYGTWLPGVSWAMEVPDHAR